MFKTSILTINALIDVLEKLSVNCYSKPCNTLSKASIGQHTRHVIELYESLLNGYSSGEICYDKRKRDKTIEADKNVAIGKLNTIKTLLKQPDKPLVLVHEFQDNTVNIETNYYREVLFNLEHLIHHQALIRVGVENETEVSVSDAFGIAASTIKHKKECLN